MAVLDFGIKRILKQGVIQLIVLDAFIFIVLFFKLNNLNDLLDEKINIAIPLVIFLFPVLFILLIHVFDTSFIRVEVLNSKLILTSLRHYQIKSKEIEIKEGMTYMITRKNGLRSNLMRYVRVYVNKEEVYVIKEMDLNEEQIEQVISFFRVHVPDSFKREEK